MRNTLLSLIFLALLANGCDRSKDPFKVRFQETAFTFNYKSPYYDDEGVKLDSALFTNSTFRSLPTGHFFSLARLELNNSEKTLLVKETPKRKHLNNTYRLITFDENNKPISTIHLYRYGLETDRIEITKDTIFKHIVYGGTAWVEKIIINNKGEFVHLGDERIWVKPEKKIKRTYEEMMQDMP